MRARGSDTVPRVTRSRLMAAYHGHAKIVEGLIATGADLDAQDEVGYTALFHAAGNKGKRGRQRCIELLVAAGADAALRNRGDATALDDARAIKSFEGAADLEALLAKR